MEWIFVAKIEDKQATGWLIQPDLRCMFPARSGPYGKGMMPEGRYRLGGPVVLSHSTGKVMKEHRPYTDKNGLAWFVPLAPLFPTKRTGLGIHPDGNVPGTLGCLGMTAKNTYPVLEKFRAGDELNVLYYD